MKYSNIDYVAKLWKKRIKILKQMKGKIDKIPVDFRKDFTLKYFELSRQMREMMALLEHKVLMAS